MIQSYIFLVRPWEGSREDGKYIIKMDWDNLQHLLCPKCGKKLELEGDRYECSSFDCAFSIGEKRALEIIQSVEDAEFKRDLDDSFNSNR